MFKRYSRVLLFVGALALVPLACACAAVQQQEPVVKSSAKIDTAGVSVGWGGGYYGGRGWRRGYYGYPYGGYYRYGYRPYYNYYSYGYGPGYVVYI